MKWIVYIYIPIIGVVFYLEVDNQTNLAVDMNWLAVASGP